MSELMRPDDTPGVPTGHERISGPAQIRREAEYFDDRARADADAVEVARNHHEGLAARVVASGDGVHDEVERLRHGGTPSRGELRPLAEALAKHCKGTEATARRALEDHQVALDAVAEDREEGDRLREMMAYLMAGEAPEGTYALTVGGTLANIDQYVAHQQRDLVPAIERELSPTESARLARAFPG